MECPFELPVEKIIKRPYANPCIEDVENIEICMCQDEAQADYIIQAINSHEKLVDLANDLRSGLKYLRDTQGEPYGFGIDRLEKKLQALKEAEKK